MMCMRCGKKGHTRRWTVEIAKNPDYGAGWFFNQQWHLCADCTDVLLDQISVVISNETWPGDDDESR